MGIDLTKAKGRLDAFRKAAEERKNRGEFLDLKEEGDYLIRILPPVGKNDWCVEAHYHRDIRKGLPPLLCPKETFQLTCPICELVDDLFGTKDKDDRETAFKIRAKMRIFANALSLDKDADGKPKIFAFGSTIYQQILAYITNDEYGDITDPVKGFDLKINRTGLKQNDTKYTVHARRNPSPVANYETVKTTMVDLGARLKSELKTYEQLSAILAGEDTEPVAAAGETSTESDFEASPRAPTQQSAPPPPPPPPAPPADDGFGASAQTAPPSPEKSKLNSALARLKAQRAGAK